MSLSISTSFVLSLMLTSLIDAQSINASSKAFASSSSTVSTVKETTVSSPKLISQATTPVTYYVSGNGSNKNNGLSASSAFRTIQRAADLTNPGDTILIMNGVYTNTYPGAVVYISRPGTAQAWIKYQAYPGHTPKIKHNTWNGIVLNKGVSYIEVQGLDIEGNNANITLNYAKTQRYNTNNPLTSGNCLYIDGRKGGYPHHIRILNNKIHNCGGVGISAVRSDYVTISGNEVFNNAWYSPFANSGISIGQGVNTDSNTGYKMYITNNKVYNNRQYIPWVRNGKITDGNGIIVDDTRNTQNGSTLPPYTGRTLIANNISYQNGGSGIHTFKGDYVDIVNNTTYLNNQSPEIDYGQIMANTSTDVKILNNIMYSIPGKRINSNWNNTNVTYNYNLYANSSKIEVKGVNDIVGDPQFVNASTGDFRLLSTSPAINQGLQLIQSDFINNPRPYGGASDIGAYEYQF
ncbi:right-handed parallel beta-helix repeat-containing protein [Nostoc sp. FACHB-152]|nr:right-handed parallel beta-helix repeat-containing protein [Nostoc sp. FACHB-152]MBD2449520.1 right-handed parallel beta-helix repeat-containing protein [Nostoc sp. FACHB-152]MBD2470263.1 right-handed parallel beta-helix repeat-containing protein [Nostoc sp. FACHB-145]